MSSILLHGGVLLAATAATVAVAAILSRYWGRRHANAIFTSELATFVQVIGTLYAVLLAFVLLSVWDQYDTARQAADREAHQIADLVRLAGGLPEPSSARLKVTVRDYSTAVVDEEWRLMAHGGRSARADRALDDLWKTLVATEPVGDRAVNVHGQALERLRNVSDSRQDRLSQARPSVGTVIWVLLIGGGALTLISTSFFETSGRIHLPVTTGLALMIAFMLYLVYAFDHPFSYDVGTGPDALRAVLDIAGR
jgi:hypothetical protein